MRFVSSLIVLAFVCGLASCRTGETGTRGGERRPTTRLASTQPATRPAFDPDHEVLIRDGHVIDGAGNAWTRADVLIRGSKILAIGSHLRASPAAEVIDARNLTISPGFIDVHTHADAGAIGSLTENFIRDGVTTIVCGNCGGSPRDVGTYFERLRSKGCALNVACLYGHNTVLEATKGSVARKLTPEEMARAKELVRKAMRDGAVGMSTGLIYRPGLYSDTEEIIELQREAAKFGGIYATHMRSEGSEIIDAIDEAL